MSSPRAEATTNFRLQQLEERVTKLEKHFFFNEPRVNRSTPSPPVSYTPARPEVVAAIRAAEPPSTPSPRTMWFTKSLLASAKPLSDQQ